MSMLIFLSGSTKTHRYSPVLGPGDHFWQSYEENQVQKIRHRIYHTIFCSKKIKINRHFVPGNGCSRGDNTIFLIWHGPACKSYRTVCLGAPANFRILHSRIRHETNKQWKSSYKKPRCSLDLRAHGRDLVHS